MDKSLDVALPSPLEELSLQDGDGREWVMPWMGKSMEQGPAEPWECSH